MDLQQSPGQQQPQQPPLPASNGGKRPPAGAAGLDSVIDIDVFNGVFSGGAGGAAVQVPARLNFLKELWPLQQSPSGAQAPPPPDAAVSTLRPAPVLDDSTATAPQPLPNEAEAAAPSAQAGGVEGAQTPLPGTSPRQSSEATEGGITQRSWRSQRGQPCEVNQDDLLDQQVAYYLKHHPDIHAQHAVWRKRTGVYQLDGREVTLEWQYATDPGGQGFIVVVDGPLKQPFSDYMEMTEKNAEYDTKSCNKSSLSMIPKEQRMSFHDQHKVYTRLEAMKVAKEQALFREKHAGYIKDGQDAPDDLLVKYKKTIQQKLGQAGRHSNMNSSGAAHPPPSPPLYAYEPPPPLDKSHVSHGIVDTRITMQFMCSILTEPSLPFDDTLPLIDQKYD